MANKINSVNFLPEYLRTDKNAKFLSATLDQWIQPADLERISGYIGSKNTPNYVSTSDIYISETLALRRDYQLTPALVTNNAVYEVQDVISLVDLIDEVALKGGKVDNLDRLLRSDFYSYDPVIDWDKLINYREYYWLVEGPAEIEVFEDIISIKKNILNQPGYTSTGTGLTLTNGLKLRFVNPDSAAYYNRDYFVEGVGTDQGIQLVDFATLITPEPIADLFKDQFGEPEYDYYKFDDQETLPLVPEYVTINRASRDVNSWSRYNRWVHAEVIRITAESKGLLPEYPQTYRAKRPIIEFRADLKLYNHGTVGISDIDFIDNSITDPEKINGDDGYYIDRVLLQKGNRVIFNASSAPETVYQVNFTTDSYKIELVALTTAAAGSQVSIKSGIDNHGTDWWFDGNIWKLSQQHTSLNQAPLFDLFTDQGESYGDNVNFPSNFRGSKIFGYTIGTSVIDPVLGFALSYRNSVEQGDYLFSNYFMTDTIQLVTGYQTVTSIPTSDTYLKFAHDTADVYVNVWTTGSVYQIPVIQFQTIITATNSVAVSAIQTPATFQVEAYLNTQKLPSTATSVTVSSGTYLVNFIDTLSSGTNVLLKFFTNAETIGDGYYEVPLGQTNNPLNGPISKFTLSELGDHLATMVERVPDFVGTFPGVSNLRDLSNIGRYGTRLIANANPIAMADMFIGKKEHSIIDAVDAVAQHYNEFKSQVIAQMNRITNQTDPVAVLDEILYVLNQDKTVQSPYYLSDMLAYGPDKNIISYTIQDPHYIGQDPVKYPITNIFSTTDLSLRSVLVYLNGNQLLLNRDYTFDVDSYVDISAELFVGDTIQIVEYTTTAGSYIPPTPTKLGLYPSFYPSIYVDDTYVYPQTVIQGHDGSITVAYNDFRDSVLLELEMRIYNNIKTRYRAELFDINSVMPGAFRSNQYSLQEINDVLEPGFIKWAGKYGIDYNSNGIFNSNDPFTWNYTGGYIPALDIQVNGYWRGIYQYLYDTQRPHTHPWEMFGFSEEPDWWSTQYTGKYEQLWMDVEAGIIQKGPRAGIYSIYARPGIIENNLIPVDPGDNLYEPDQIVNNVTIYNRRQSWKFGDQAPAETAWRRSSYFPFAVQKLLALTKPSTYAALMYDLSRVSKNIAGQWTYGASNEFLKFANLAIFNENNTLTSGYSVLISEVGTQRTQNYISQLRSDLTYANFNLFYKVGGFVSKDKLQITIDAYEPNSNSPGAILPQEDYTLRLNVSNPIISASISGLIVQKSQDNTYVVKGYDTQTPYFSVYTPIRTSNTPTITVGGISAPYVTWTNGSVAGGTQLSSIDTTSASGAAGLFYQAGQIVAYGSSYYRVITGHQAESVFNRDYYQLLPGLPTVGGATAQIADRFDGMVKEISYGTEFSDSQSVYDVIVGYGAWLRDQGFVFDEFSSQVNDVINWEFSAKEFLYWTTQNWAINNVITLSPFADQIKYTYNQSVVDDLFDPFYNSSLLLADGTQFPKSNLFVNRQNGVCTISATTSTDGIYFARLNAVQKEHSLIFNNTTIFNDVVYDIETGYQQERMKLTGFRTKDWTGDINSPGFVYDNVIITDWTQNTAYRSASVVRYNNAYYSAKKNIEPAQIFDITNWVALAAAPAGGLLPNFDYKINQFQDFYSLDIDNFDASQEKMAQHLTGYTPRVYLNNIFTDPIAQYKFYQGFIREKGTRNAVEKLSKASIQNLQGTIDFSEEWAFRTGDYGSFSTYQELEFALVEGTFLENPQIVRFVTSNPTNNDLIYYSTSSDRSIIPNNYNPATTFYTSTGTYLNNSYELPIAGYVRYDDVTFTSYNENSLLSIVNNTAIDLGDTIWLGFKNTGDWDVLRYVLAPANVVSADIGIYGEEIVFTTNLPHALSVGEIVSLINFTSQLDGVYIVQSIPTANQFSVASTLISLDPGLSQGPGQLFKFTTARAATFDSLPNDAELLSLPNGTLFWVDSNTEDGAGSWVVYNKTQNYYPTAVTTGIDEYNEQLGFSISRVGNDGLFVVGSPACTDPVHGNAGYGKATVYVKINPLSPSRLRFYLNQYETAPYFNQNSSMVTGFGSAVAYDDLQYPGTQAGLIFVGAPLVSYANMTGTGFIHTVTETTSTTINNWTSLIEQGLITVSSIDPVSNEENRLLTLASPYPQNYERFGSELYVQQNTATKLLLVGAPGQITGVGSIYAYQVGHVTSETTTTLTISYISSLTTIASTPGMQWGHSISGSDDGSVIAVGAPGYLDRTGLVHIFNGTLTSQIIYSPFSQGGGFGFSTVVSADGNCLVVSAPDDYGFNDNNQSYGRVAIFHRGTDGLFNTTTSVQILTNPLPNSKMKFGETLAINESSNVLVVSALGTDYIATTFDEKQTRNIGGIQIESTVSTLDDGGSTDFFTEVERTGTVYVYNKQHTRFVLSEELPPHNAYQGVDHGYSLGITADNTIFVGAPAIDNASTGSYFYQYVSTSTNAFSWESYRTQDAQVDMSTIQRLVLIDTYNEQVVDYLETIDPAKGYISGLADQELKYKSLFDPAIYAVGSTGTVVNPDANWTDDHVGELWWDLSTVKYQWYEQGDLEYRKNNWGSTFPGSVIDVYEWMGSYLLPSQWSQQADTTVGLTQGISGQPKYPDDSSVAVKQTYDPVTGYVSNYYYYWIKNTVIVPAVQGRKTSAYQVASVIADPVGYGVQYATPISADAIALANIGGLPVGDRIHLNISTDLNPNNVPRHTEWLLLQENNADSQPNSLLEKKLLDSLIGHDSLGNLVPDPGLSPRQAYGVSIRPRQSLFKNRFQALRNLLAFTNGVLINTPITGNYSFKNLNENEQIPNQFSHEWDQQVETLADRDAIDTRQFTPAVAARLTAVTTDGKISSVIIDNPGFGYLISPTVTVSGNSLKTAVITTEIDSLGQITTVNIIDPGEGYPVAPELSVRGYTVIVINDSQAGGRWATHTWDAYNNRWARVHTQNYDTRLYWNYADYLASAFSQYKIVDYTVDSTYELNTIIGAVPGQYIKIKNVGDGRSVIITPTTAQYGTFSDGYDLLWSQRGTIQLSNDLWDIPDSQLGFDENNNFDTTLYNQAPDLELEYILAALKEDIFIDDLKINWNLFFFTAVKYCLYEQKLLDWAFKTAFINVTNYAGALQQRPVYKITTSSYFEEYINEVKPYHTQIRNFTTNNTLLDSDSSYNTDFDLPSYYNSVDDKFEIVNINNDLSNTYPWKSWKDNYGYGVDSIEIIHPGTLYTAIPEVIISNPDLANGTTATAQAYIGGKSVYQITILDAGSGYTNIPTATLVDGTTGTTATVSVRLINERVRRNTIGIKFDRVSSVNQIGDIDTVDEFFCDGSKTEYVLSWLAEADKQTMTVLLDDDLVLINDYTVRYFTAEYNGYNKKYSKLVFLNYIPKKDQVVKITYKKNVEIMTAFERINYFTSSTDLITADPGLSLLQGPLFSHTSDWSEPYPAYDTFAWSDATTNYSSAVIKQVFFPRTLQLDSVANIGLYQYANITTIDSPAFSTATAVVVTIDTLTNTVTFNTQTQIIAEPEHLIGGTIEFWNNDTNFSILDVATSATSWSNTKSNALSQYMGIDPSDFALNTSTGLYLLGGIANSSTLLVDGDGFYTERTSFSPEELIAGQSSDSLGINVYTKNHDGSPTVLRNYFNIEANTASSVMLDILPPNVDSIGVTVNFDGVSNDIVFDYTTSTLALDDTTFSIDWPNSVLTIAPQTRSGLVGYTIILVDGTQYIDHSQQTSLPGVDQIQLRSLGAYNSLLRSAYVTLDGVTVSATTSTSTAYYEMNYIDVGGDQENLRAAVDIYNVSTSSAHLAQAWFFDSDYKGFNEVLSQTFAYDGSTNSFTMLYPPGNLGPAEAMMIVEVVNSQGTRRLMPPDISYTIWHTGDSLTFNFPTTFGVFRESPTPENFAAYRNGNLLAYGYDYVQNGETITIIPNVMMDGDTIAIISYAQNDTLNYDFSVSGNMLNFNINGNTAYTPAPGDVIKVITFNNQDDMLMQTQIFASSRAGLYQISRPVLDARYVWVSVDGESLINPLDFSVLGDQRTIQLADQFTGDTLVFKEVVVTSVSSSADPVLGYRIFTDMFGQTQFKRLSKSNTTYLTQPLYVYDTEIYVNDSTTLSKPLVSKRIPGVVIIDGERIEYYRIQGNVLSQLRRGTLGTAAKYYSQEYTKVIDQGIAQTMPYNDSVRRQTYINLGTTNTYIISTASSATYYTKDMIEISGVVSTSTVYTLHSNSFYNNLDRVQILVNGQPIDQTTATYAVSAVPSPAVTASTILISISNLTPSADYVVEGWFIGRGQPGTYTPYLFNNSGITLFSDTVAVSTATVYINHSSTGSTATIAMSSVPINSNFITVNYTTGTFTWVEDTRYPLAHYAVTTATTSTRSFVLGNGINASNTNTVVLRNGYAMAPYYDYLIHNTVSSATVEIIPNVLMPGDDIAILYYTATTTATVINPFVFADLPLDEVYYNDANFTYRVKGNTATIVNITTYLTTATFVYSPDTNWTTSTDAQQFTVDSANNLIIPPQSRVGELDYTVASYEVYVDPADQVEVYYGGRQLRKRGVFHQDTTKAYDSAPVLSTTATVYDIISLPNTTVINTAYVVLNTNQVWVYTASDRYGSYNGYEYQGLDYLPPEFTIDPLTQELTLNIPEALESHLPVRVDVVKRDYAAITEWNDPDPMNVGNTLSIMMSTSTQARFLQDQPAELPDSYYYGGDRDLTDASGFSLTQLGIDPLEEN